MQGLADVDPSLDAIVRTCLATDPTARFPSARELEAALSALLSPPEDDAPPEPPAESPA